LPARGNSTRDPLVPPALIVNAAAYTAVDKAESEQASARAVNAEAPAVMAQEAKKIGACLVHYSTDYVFDGLKTAPYNEEDQTNPQNVYGKTKLEGENAIFDSGVPHLIFRTAWVYATEGRNFLLSILRLATQREELKIVCDQTGRRPGAEKLPRLRRRFVESLGAIDGPPSLSGVSGIYHMTAGGETTWFDFAKAVLEKGLAMEASTPWLQQRPATSLDRPPDSSDPHEGLSTAARRPVYSSCRTIGWRIRFPCNCLIGEPTEFSF